MLSYFLSFFRFYCLFCFVIWDCSFGSNAHWLIHCVVIFFAEWRTSCGTNVHLGQMHIDSFIVLSISLQNEEQAVAQMFIWVKHTLTINCVVILFAEWRTSCGTLSLERLPSSPPPARTYMSTLTSWWELRPWVSVLPVMILYLSITSDIFVCQYWKYCLGISVLKVLSLFLSIASNVSYVSGSVVSNVFESQYCK